MQNSILLKEFYLVFLSSASSFFTWVNARNIFQKYQRNGNSCVGRKIQRRGEKFRFSN